MYKKGMPGKNSSIVFAAFLVSVAVFTFGSFAGAEDIPPASAPMSSPAPVPACLYTSFHQIILNNIYDENGFLKNSFYLFVTRWYIDNISYKLIGDSNYISAGQASLSYDTNTKLYVLKFKMNGYDICITAPFYAVFNTTRDMEVEQRGYLNWFKTNFPGYSIPHYLDKPLLPAPVIL